MKSAETKIIEEPLDSDEIQIPVQSLQTADPPPEVVKPKPTKRYNSEQIKLMSFKVKTDDDQVNDRGIIQYERCQICKWFIEKGNSILELSCSHRFHKKCMEMQLITSSQCAICGEEASMENLFGK